MPLTIDPSIEACQALVARINGGTYSQSFTAEYSEIEIDPLEEINALRVDVVTDESETLEDSLEIEGRSSHLIRVWIRDKVSDLSNATINPLKLLVRQLFQRLNDFNSSDRRVEVWECDVDEKQNPDKNLLKSAGLFVSSILLRVEVAPPA